MTARLAEIVRHPIKAIGREILTDVTLEVGRPLPWDRAFAIAHSAAKITGSTPGWAHKANFLRGVSGPELMAVTARFDPSGPTVTMAHPAQPSIDVALGDAASVAAFLAWLEPLWPAGAARPTHLVHTPGTALTDVPDPWVSINSTASLSALGDAIGMADFSPHRFRGNLWLEGLPPWAEFDWVGKEIKIGSAVLRVEERITRCKATHANPDTGQRDADTLGTLERVWGHTDFGVYALVTQGGMVRAGDPVVLP